MRPTWRKIYRRAGEPIVQRHGSGPSVITDTKGTFFDGSSDSRIMNTAPMKLRYETLKRHGKDAFRRTFKPKN